MALRAVCFLLLLFSMLPLFDATDCDRGLYCPAGSDCNSDNALCEAGSDNCTISEENKPDCDEGIRAFFSLSQFAVRENNGPVEPVIRITKPLECCSISLMIKVEDGTTIGNIDYDFPRGGYIEAIIPSGMETASFAIRLKDDNKIEGDEYFYVSIVNESLPHGVTWGGQEKVRVYIQDDDDGCVHLGRQTAYSVRENAILQVGLELTTVATYDIDVTIGTTAFTASRCDFQNVRYTATFKAGNTRASFRIDITDDDIFEGNEGFNFEIDSDTSSAVVARCRSGFRGSVTILDDEREISVGFDSSTYTVEEDVGVVLFSPELTLDRPSPCCITVLAEVVNGTALGRGVDCGYSPPERYEYVFPAGETCATPDKPIPIIDDRISERDERFTMTILPLSLPLGVKASRSTATITIKDLDIAVTFEDDEYTVDEGKVLKLRLRLDKTSKQEVNLQVFSVDITATSDVDYIAGPYNVTFRKNSRTSNEFSVGIIKDPTYTGNKLFSLIIDDDRLPLGLVAGDIRTANVTIVDNEYTVCFNRGFVSVVEKERVELVLEASKRLSRSERVNLIYSNGTGYPATFFPRAPGDYWGPLLVYVSTTVTVRIATRPDNILEYNETFAVSISPDLIHNSSAAADCITTVYVVIIDDDCPVTVEFQATKYPPPPNKNELLKPVLKLSNPVAYAIQVTLQGENGTAKSGEDYTIQNRDPIIVYPDTLNKEIFIDTVDDDVVETLIEEFYIVISYVANENGGVNDCLEIGTDSRTTLQIKDDDGCKVMIIEDRLTFSKAIYRNVSIEIQHIKGPPFRDWLLAGDTNYILNVPIADIEKIKVCIPKDLFDERPRRRVSSDNRKVEICSF